MKTFRVRYYECYEDYYEVEANSKEEAEEILKKKLGVESRDIALLAPTGRSAKRMTEAVGAPGYKSYTEVFRL